MTDAAPQYIATRSVLLDALEALAQHRRTVALVGAQAVYQRTEVVEGTGIPITTSIAVLPLNIASQLD